MVIAIKFEARIFFTIDSQLRSLQKNKKECLDRELLDKKEGIALFNGIGFFLLCKYFRSLTYLIFSLKISYGLCSKVLNLHNVE